jgi:hypothetical protein
LAALKTGHALGLGTLYTWEKIAERMPEKFGTPTAKKDVESRYNKRGQAGDGPILDERSKRTSSTTGGA